MPSYINISLPVKTVLAIIHLFCSGLPSPVDDKLYACGNIFFAIKTESKTLEIIINSLTIVIHNYVKPFGHTASNVSPDVNYKA